MGVSNTIGAREAEAFLSAFKEIRSRQAAQQLHIFGWWLPQYKSWIARAGRFNVFKALGIEADELRHSRFLGFLLDPSAGHDQRARFLRSFLELIDCEHSFVDAELESARIYVERPIGDLGRIDIAICFPAGEVVAIENKIWAAEQENQVARYQRWVQERRRSSADRSFVVFLHPTGNVPHTRDDSILVDVKLISYATLADWLSRIAEGVADRLKEVIYMYGSVCRDIGGRAI